MFVDVFPHFPGIETHWPQNANNVQFSVGQLLIIHNVRVIVLQGDFLNIMGPPGFKHVLGITPI